MNLYIDTCVLPRGDLEAASLYRERFGPGLGFELLPMFDLPGWEDDLIRNLDLFSSGPLLFHEPVWGVEHSAPRGSKAWEAGMYHLRLTRKYADILHPAYMVYHLCNCKAPASGKDRMLCDILRNLEDMRELFHDVSLLVENTGIVSDHTCLFDQEEFTSLCLEHRWNVQIDVGHANANGWDLFRLIRDLKDQIRGFHLHNNDGIHDYHNRLRDGTIDFNTLLPFISRTVPGALPVIEYTRPAFHGDPLCEDIRFVLQHMDESLL